MTTFVFLDVDGTINVPILEDSDDIFTSRFFTARGKVVRWLKELSARPDTEVVWSTTWNNHVGTLEIDLSLPHWRQVYQPSNLVEEGVSEKVAEVLNWFREHAESEDRCVILDDAIGWRDFENLDQEDFILLPEIDPEIGIDKQIMTQVIDFVGRG